MLFKPLFLSQILRSKNMAEVSEKGISYTGGFFMLIALAVGGMMIGGMLSIPVVMVMSGKSITSVTDIMNNPAYFREMQVMQGISAIMGFLVPTIFSASLMSSKPLELTGFKGRATGRQILITVLIIACGLALSSSLGYLSYQISFPKDWVALFQKLENDYAKMAANLIRLNNGFELLVSIIVLALLPAVCEEALFRGGLQNYLYRGTKKFWFSVIIVSLLFSIVHFSFYGFLSRFALGIILGLLYQYSGKLWLPIIAHFVNNATAVLVMYFQKADGKNIADILNEKDGSYIGFLTIPLIIFLFIKFRQISVKDKTTNGI